MMLAVRPVSAPALLLFLITANAAFPLGDFDARADGGGIVPALGSEASFGIGYDYGAAVEFPLPGPFDLSVNYSALSVPVPGTSSLGISEGSMAASVAYDPVDLLSLRLRGGVGLYAASFGGSGANGVSFSTFADIRWRLTPSLTLGAELGAKKFLARSGTLLDAARAGAFLSFRPAGLDRTSSRLRVEKMRIEQVFPVFYSFYDENSFGSIVLRNDETSTVKNVRVSFLAPSYMSRAKVCLEVESLAPGETLSVPVFALFDESMLSLTERAKTEAEFLIEYQLIGSNRKILVPTTLSLQHRNAMTWSDDRRAAAFVSAQDPAVLWFSRYVGGIIRDRMRAGLDPNLQYAIGLFEALRIFGLSYVVDPSSSYVAMSDDEETIDYLQFPYQTLFYRGGDCDDLSILFSALLQSIGIESGFITVPGHIYIAFALSGETDEAVRSIYDPDLFFVKDGKAWVPLEITMVKDGFLKAWRVGAKEWRDNDLRGEARFYPMSENWRLYRAVGVPGVNPRFLLPDEAETMNAFDQSLDRYAVREIEGEIARIASDPAAFSRSEERTSNEIGIEFARFGMIKEAWTKFRASATMGFAPAWINLAHIAFLRKDFELAVEYYKWSLSLADDNAEAILGIARCQYELGRYAEASVNYGQARDIDPVLSGKYGYLVSLFGGTGRAWSLAERASSVRWLSELQSRPMPIQKVEAAPLIAAAPPEDREILEKRAINEAVAVSPFMESYSSKVVLRSPAISVAPVEKGTQNKDAERVVEQPEAEATRSGPVSVSAIAALPERIPAATEEVEEPPPKIGEAPLMIGEAPSGIKEALVVVMELPTLFEEAAAKMVDAPSISPEKSSVEKEPAYNENAEEEGPVYYEIVKGFGAFKSGLGKWTIGPDRVAQTDTTQMFAKIVASLALDGSPARFRFGAKATGRDWIGLGLHFLVAEGEPTAKGYGYGLSYLVWFTHDQKAYGEQATRVQAYRSYGAVDLRLVADAPIDADLFDRHEFRIDYDAGTGEVAVFVDERNTLVFRADMGWKPGGRVSLRALDAIEFYDFRVEATDHEYGLGERR